MDNTRILFWNCQGLAPKRLELLNFIHDKKIDILLLNETHLTSTRKFKIANFHTYATNRPQVGNRCPGGGTAVLIHRRFIHHQVQIPTTSIENTTVHLQLGLREVRLSAVYKSPQTPLNTADIHTLLDSDMNTIIAGDLNAKNTIWNSSRTNAAGNLLERYISTRNDTTVIAPDSPTHYPDISHHTPDVLDIAIMKTGGLRYELENLTNELSSDHTAILLDLQARGTHISPPKPLRIVNWAKFEVDLMESLQVNPYTRTKEQIDSAINRLTSDISKAISQNSKAITPTDRKHDLPRNI
jgi:hypothetical protein